MSTVLLTGATGLVGRICLDLLLDDPHFTRVTVVARRSLYLEHAKLTEFIRDFDQLDEIREAFHADIVICCLGSTIKDAGSRAQFMKIDHDYPLEIARLARQGGARHFMVISAIGASQNSLFFYSRVKGMMEEDVRTIPFESISIFRPSLIDGERKEVRVMEELTLKIGRLLSRLMKGPLQKYKPVSAALIARAICHSAKIASPGIHHYSVEEIESLSSRYGD